MSRFTGIVFFLRGMPVEKVVEKMGSGVALWPAYLWFIQKNAVERDCRICYRSSIDKLFIFNDATSSSVGKSHKTMIAYQDHHSCRPKDTACLVFLVITDRNERWFKRGVTEALDIIAGF